jgi:hypothetical protein
MHRDTQRETIGRTAALVIATMSGQLLDLLVMDETGFKVQLRGFSPLSRGGRSASTARRHWTAGGAGDESAPQNLLEVRDDLETCA